LERRHDHSHRLHLPCCARQAEAMAESATTSSAPRGSDAKQQASSFSMVITPPQPADPNLSASKPASVAVELETPLIESPPPAGTRVLLTRTSSDLVIRLPPLHWAKATFFANGNFVWGCHICGVHGTNRQLSAAAHVAAVWVERQHGHPHRLHPPRHSHEGGASLVDANVLLPDISC
ncbi:hypothetical protein CLOP_g7533, partial [Closterium sp. NIES-67]